MAKASVQGRLNRETNPIPGEIPGFNPQFIDDDGYATDVTPSTPFPSGNYVQTEGGVWVPQKGTDNGEAFVQLTGRKIEKEYLLSRQIRSEREGFVDRTVPDGAIGAVFVCQIYGRTGSFGANQGLSLRVYQSTDSRDVSGWRIWTDTTTTMNRPQMIYIYPGVSKQELTLQDGADVKAASLPVHSMLRTEIVITGTFQEGEGFDCDAYVNWLY